MPNGKKPSPCSVASGSNANLLLYTTRRAAGFKKGGAPMAFLLTVVFYYAEPDRPPKVHREQLGSYMECERARVDALSKPPSGVKTVSAVCVSGQLPKGWKDR
jgi:hypothetical protein